MSSLKNGFTNIILLITLTLLALISTISGYSWCDPKLCEKGVKHIACRNNGEFEAQCPRDSVGIDISRFKNYFVDAHNKRRNYLALGKIPGFYSAARMPTMVWDDELQYLAELNLRTCILDHDGCHTTYRYSFAGQNLCAVARGRYRNVNITGIIEEVMNLWFDEYPLIDNTYISRFRVTKYFEDYGHFAEMAVDRNTHLGCGIIRYTRPNVPFAHIYHVVCNYASVYALDTPVYEVGNPASKCKTGKNPNYPGLCSTREQVNPNY